MYEESEIVVDVPVVVSAALKSDYEKIATGGVDAFEESDVVVDIPAVVPWVKPVPITDETTTNLDACQKSESDGGLPGVANLIRYRLRLERSLCSLNPLLFRWILNLKLLCYCPRSGSRDRSLKFALYQRVVRTQGFWRAECMMKLCVMLRKKRLLTVRSVALLG